MQYEIIKKYSCKEATCGELVKKLKDSKGNSYCVLTDFIDPIFPDDVAHVWECWDWIQARLPKKKLYLVDEIKSIGHVI